MKKRTVSSRTIAAAKRAVQAAKQDFHGYDFILLVDSKTYKAEALGGRDASAHITMYEKGIIHRQALKEALKNGIYHYEWSEDVSGQTTWFQTTCVVLSQSVGRANKVLSLSRNISRWGRQYTVSRSIREWAEPKTFSQILLATREAEKREISKALHDEVGSSSVILTALLSLVKLDVQKGATKRALRDIEQLDQQIKEGIERLRNIIISLRPPMLDNPGGLCGAIRDLLENVSALNHLPYQFNCKTGDDEMGLTENVRILLYRIVQEAVTNIVKHARAKHIDVSLKQMGSKVCLQVKDDGVGFDTTQFVSIQHIGLLAMKDSVEMMGGTITIKSALGKGTRIEVTCPSVVYGGKNK